MRIIPLLLALFSLAPPVVWSAPVVSGVTGAVSNGQSITISGSDFGSGPTIAVFDDFEKGINGDNISTSTNGAQVGTWSHFQQDLYPTYSNASHVSGSLCFRADMANYWGNRLYVALPGITSYFFSYWVYLPAGDSWPGEGQADGINWKVMWFTNNDNFNGGLTEPVILASDGTSASDVTSAIAGDPPTNLYGDERNIWPNLSFSKGTWIRVWGYTNIASSGKVRIWQLTASGVHTGSDLSLDTSSCGEIYYATVNGYSRQTSNCHPMYDDVYIAYGSNAQARVEIGNAATYTACTNLAICTPTSWGDTSITATVRMGSFATGTAYLYVVDADGAVSDGCEITLGGSGAPAPPTISNATISNGRVQ